MDDFTDQIPLRGGKTKFLYYFFMGHPQQKVWKSEEFSGMIKGQKTTAGH